MYISRDEIQKLALKLKIKLNKKQIDLLKIEFENIIFKRLNIIDEFNLKKLKPLRYPNLKNTTGLRDDSVLIEDIVKKNENLLNNNRIKKNKLNLYLISSKKK